MLARRLLILLAVVLGLTALAAGVAPRTPVDSGTAPTAPSAPGAAAPTPLERTIRTSSQGERIEVRVGQVVVITVEGDELETVSLEEYGSEPVEPASPARFELLADVPGTYAIELLGSGREIGTLVVSDPGEEAAPAAGPDETAS
jgi:hypothetical protein